MVENKEYCGWKNYNTWSIALWLNSDGLVDYFGSEIESLKGIRSYRTFIKYMGLARESNGDGVKYLDSSLDYKELTAMLLGARASAQ